MNHFLEISQLSPQQINALVSRAIHFKRSNEYPHYSCHTVANLFYENSTRTRVSFELAAKKLSMSTINLDLQYSSETKGEAIEDTLKTLAAMGIDFFVIRHRQEGLQRTLAEKLTERVHIINAGDGQHAHPSQALLDWMTIVENKPDATSLKIAIVGNIRHSRVANSFQSLCATLNVGELVFIAPPIWQPQNVHYGRLTASLQDGLTDADVIICLRVQQERLLEEERLDLDYYYRHYALTEKTLRYAKPGAIVMHPGPVNRGVEIDSSVADGVQSCILQQVTNGVFMRMAILELLV
ncbi:aspartate carbamoyltransferase catalytic subunit [Legionella fairfieldensis]|uniref:aspartate carbamoyltransferase catalytic subunit n=1 Tax=Legionella fairfieldensis TaxID=45064 RepID=UPI000491C62B|nr:aspartate carbamoyltransferase catalytic subunit [Legionella fairfieldensis]